MTKFYDFLLEKNKRSIKKIMKSMIIDAKCLVKSVSDSDQANIALFSNNIKSKTSEAESLIKSTKSELFSKEDCEKAILEYVQEDMKELYVINNIANNMMGK